MALWDLLRLQYTINTSKQYWIKLSGWAIIHVLMMFMLIYENDNFIQLQLVPSWSLGAKQKSSLSHPARMFWHHRIQWLTFSLAFKGTVCGGQHALQRCSKCGPFVLSCIHTSFVVFKISVNIPLSGPASVQQIRVLTVERNYTRGKSQVWHTMDPDIWVMVMSQREEPLS